MILKLGEGGPIAPWRLLFLLEGFPAVVVATFTWRLIPDSPERAAYLTRREKLIAQQRLLPPGHKPPASKASKPLPPGSVSSHGHDMNSRFVTSHCSSICAVLSDPIPWTTAAIFFLTNVAFASLPVFLPSILTQMGHSPVASQALAAPPYLVAFIAVLAVAKVSDALQSRAYLIAAAALFSAGGYAFLALSHSVSDALGGSGSGMDMARYLALYPAAVGFFCVVVLTIAWNVNNARGQGHKGAGFALMQVIGQCGPLVGTRLYPKTDGPWFTRGMGICAVAMFGVAGLAIGLRAHLAKLNRRMNLAKEIRDNEEGQGLVGGSRATRAIKRGETFRYML